MATVISGDTGVSQVQAGSINQDDLAANVVGKGPAFSAYQNSAQSITASLWTKVQLQVKEFDTGSAFDNTTNYRFQPTVAGYYQCNAGAQFATGNANTRLAFYKNGAVAYYGPSPATGTASMVSALVYLNGSTDYLEVYANTSSTQSTTVGQGLTFFQGFLARAA